LATVVAVITIVTGILTIRDQLFGGSGDPAPASPTTSPSLPAYEDRVGNFDSADQLLDFLNRNDSNVVDLSLAFDSDVVDFDTEGAEGIDPYVVLYYEPCSVPNGQTVSAADGCPGTQLSISGQEPDGTSKFYFSGGLRLEGFYRVRALREMHQGISAIALEALKSSEF